MRCGEVETAKTARARLGDERITGHSFASTGDPTGSVGYNAPAVRNLLFGIYVCTCLAALIWPGYHWLGGRIEPYILGLPFSLAWVMGWVLMTFAVMVAYNLTNPESVSVREMTPDMLGQKSGEES